MSLPQTGSLIAGKYRLEAPLGEGGMGAVFRARHELMGKPVALKWLKAGFTDSTRAEERFLQEARAAARIHHPHVVDVYDVGRHETGLYMVMELLEGQDFASMLDAGELPFPVALRHLVSAMRGVMAAHAAGITHRDIKPENIFIAYDAHYTEGIAKILDFGISKLHDDSHIGRTGPGVAMGTPHYMSFEQMNGESDIDQRTDIYAFGVLLYRMLTGVLPFDGATPTAILVARVHGSCRSPAELRPDVPRAVDRVVMKAMALRREDRYATLAELIGALEQSGALTLNHAWQAPRGPLAATTLPQPRDSRNPTPDAAAPMPTHGATFSRAGAQKLPWLLGGLAFVAAAALAVTLFSNPPAARPAALPSQVQPVQVTPATTERAAAAEPPRVAAQPAASEQQPGKGDVLSAPVNEPRSTRTSAEATRPMRRKALVSAPDAGVVAARVMPVEAPVRAPTQEPPPTVNAPTHRSGSLRKEDL